MKIKYLFLAFIFMQQPMMLLDIEDGVIFIKISEKGSGAGTIIDKRGYVITANHCVKEKESVEITLHNRQVFTAKVIAKDKNLDLALLKIDTDKELKLRVLELIKEDDPEVGESINIIGHPVGLRYSITKGIISAINRRVELPKDAAMTNLIQTDAAVNIGNSGGPLINKNGKVVGIAIAVHATAKGIAFARNSGDIRRFLSNHLPK